MALILNIDSSTTICSVALAKDGDILDIRENSEGLNHSQLLAVYVDEILKDNNYSVSDLDAIAISQGPGSYTGLRIGTSLAKGLCFGANLPLIAVPTLKALALGVALDTQKDALYCPMLDARRMEVYTSFYNKKNETIVDTKAEIIDENSFSELLENNTIYFFGNGCNKVSNVIKSENAKFIFEIETSAKYLVKLSESMFHNNNFADIAYYEPFYLKDFIATTPKKSLF